MAETQAKPAEVPKKKRNQGFEDLDENQTLITQLRILIPNADGGAVIGKGGENVKHLRYKYHAKVAVADCSTPERVLKVEVMIAVVRAVVLDIMRFINSSDEERRLKIMIHDSQAGAVIGKQGSRIKQLKEQCNTFIRVFPRCAPNSTERVYEVIGKPQDIALAVSSITELLYPIQRLGVMIYYDPENYTECLIEEYGGYRVEEGFPKGYIGRNSLKAGYKNKGGYEGGVVTASGGEGGGGEGGGGEGGDDKPVKRKRGCRAGKHKRNRVCAAAVKENKVAAAAALERHNNEESSGDQDHSKHKAPPNRPFGTLANSYPRPSFPRGFNRGPGGYGRCMAGGGGMMVPPVMMAPPMFNPPHHHPPQFPSSYNHPPRQIPVVRHSNPSMGFDEESCYANNGNNNKVNNPTYNHQQGFYPSVQNDSNFNPSISNNNMQHSNNVHLTHPNNSNSNLIYPNNNSNSNNYPNNNYYTGESKNNYPSMDEGATYMPMDMTEHVKPDHAKSECIQISMPIDTIESIAGANGMRLKQVMQETGAEINIEPPSADLPNQFIIGIKGTQDQIKNSQYLLQMCVVRYSGKMY